jgi:tetrahydromethanopterin S-methyltransferase subunit B
MGDGERYGIDHIKQVACDAAEVILSKAIVSYTAAQAKVEQKVDTLIDEMKGVKDCLEKKYVRKDVFEPVKNIVYGFVGLILIAVAGALISLVVMKLKI